MNKQKTKKQLLFIPAMLAMILACGIFTSNFAQTSAGSYWSPAARKLREEIINRAIIRQAARGRGGSNSRHRSPRRSGSRRHR